MNNFDYPYIKAYGAMMGSAEYYVQGELRRARIEDAPRNATHSTEEGWATVDDIHSVTTRETLERTKRSMDDRP